MQQGGALGFPQPLGQASVCTGRGAHTSPKSSWLQSKPWGPCHLGSYIIRDAGAWLHRQPLLGQQRRPQHPTCGERSWPSLAPPLVCPCSDPRGCLLASGCRAQASQAAGEKATSPSWLGHRHAPSSQPAI